MAGEPLFVQRCGDEPLPVDLTDQEGADATCRPESRGVESLLLYTALISDALTQ